MRTPEEIVARLYKLAGSLRGSEMDRDILADIAESTARHVERFAADRDATIASLRASLVVTAARVSELERAVARYAPTLPEGFTLAHAFRAADAATDATEDDHA